ncbi:MAG: radical SAM/SPASM domain-containing protein [Planctomycetota bacterium]
MAMKIDREFENFVSIIADLASKAEKWDSRPAWIEYATNNICNLECVMCSKADGEPVMAMKKSDAEKVIGQIFPFASVITPSANSEPLLGDMQFLAKMCKEHQVYFNIYSNATILDGAKFEHIAPNTYKLWISLDSHVPEIFEKIRVGADFETVSRHVREIIPVAAKHRVPLGFVVVLMNENAPILADFVDWVADISGPNRAPDIRVQEMLYNSEAAAKYDVNLQYTKDEIKGFIDQAAARAKKRNVGLLCDLPGELWRHVPVETTEGHAPRGIGPEFLDKLIGTIEQKFPHFCSMASTYLKVNPDGAVFPCCRAPKELEMGNVLEKSVWEIWNGEKYRKFRKQMNCGDYPEVCSTCGVLVNNPHYQAKVKAKAKAEAQ